MMASRLRLHHLRLVGVRPICCSPSRAFAAVMPAVVKVMKMDSTLITLIKPQFEARRSQVGGGGIVRDPLVHKEVLDRIISGVEQFGSCNKGWSGWIESPIKGAEGNTEFLACFHRIPVPVSQTEKATEAT